MDIKVLPYIDPERLNQKGSALRTENTQKKDAVKSASKNTSDNTTNSSGVATESFEGTLATAQRAIESVTIDLIVSQDAKKLRQAADILSRSGSARLRELGKNLIDTGAGTGTPITPEQIFGSNASGSSTAVPGNGTNNGTQSGNSANAASGNSNASALASVASGNGNALASANAASGNSSTSGSAASRSTGSGRTTSASSNSSGTSGIVLTDAAHDKSLSYDAGSKIAKTADKAAKALGCPDSLKPYFIKAAGKYNVDVALLMAIAKQESDFQTDCVSHAGATGVMQIMPETAEELGVKNLYDPEDNIYGGAKEITSRLKDYNGDLDLALAGYNAGIGNVRKYGGIPPFKETRDYIKKVNGYYALAKK